GSGDRALEPDREPRNGALFPHGHASPGWSRAGGWGRERFESGQRRTVEPRPDAEARLPPLPRQALERPARRPLALGSDGNGLRDPPDRLLGVLRRREQRLGQQRPPDP